MSDFNRIVGSFQESLLLCRPRNVLAFSHRYFLDEASENREEAHAIHTLPFLLLNQNEFRSVACTIFCRQISMGKSTEFLDIGVVEDLVRKMDLAGFWFEVKTIEIINSEQLSKLKKIDFNLFVTAIRFPIACYQLVFWFKDELTDFYTAVSLKMGSNGINGNHAHSSLELVQDQLKPGSQVELTKLKVFILQRYRSNTSTSPPKARPSTSSGGTGLHTINTGGGNSSFQVRRSSSGYHLHQHGWSETDSKQWARVCVTGIDELIAGGKGNTQFSVEEVTNAFLRKYLITPIIPDEVV